MKDGRETCIWILVVRLNFSCIKILIQIRRTLRFGASSLVRYRVRLRYNEENAILYRTHLCDEILRMRYPYL